MKFAMHLKRDIELAKETNKPTVFLGGECGKDNWRDTIIEKYSKNFLFLDPYEPNWSPQENIYDELTGLIVADYPVFYHGGKGSEKEMTFLENVSKPYYSFNDLTKLEQFLDGILKNSKNEIITTVLRKTASILLASMKSINAIKSLRKPLATAAQKAYDEWEQDEEGMDEELGAGGICQDVAENMAGVLSEHGIEVSTVSQTVGEQHVYVYAKTLEGVVEVNIDPHVYETGAGYTWKKKQGVTIQPNDIYIAVVEPDSSKFDEMTEET
jgi:hypothetical protein